ncbi:MAG TPA: efflux RND transporter periplasmic adaptor subunit [Phycisphaerae bacterium]|nr:efflux RND transporter periplasmic adaptor subunit [Phycisphaerae bacterium]
MRWFPVVVGVSSAVMFAGIVTQEIGPDRDSAAIGAAVQPEVPLEADPQVVFSAAGVTEPQSKSVRIVGEVPGVIQSIPVRAGDTIAAGQVLVALQHDVQQASVDVAKAALDRAASNVERLRNGDRPEERAIAQAQFEEAEVALHAAERDVERVTQLVGEDAATKREALDAETARAAAAARSAAAKERWKLSEAGARPEDMARAEAELAQAQAQYDGARFTLEKAYIRSPIDGMVIYRYAEPGEYAHPDSAVPILTVGDRSTLHIRVDVDELNVGQVHIGQPVVATAQAYDQHRFTGCVVHIEPTLGRKNFRTFRTTERLDEKVQEVVVALDHGDDLPLELPMVVWFLNDAGSGR